MGRGILCPFALYKSYKAFILLLSWCYHESISISIVVCLYHFQFSHFRHHRYFGVVLESFWTSGSLTVSSQIHFAELQYI